MPEGVKHIDKWLKYAVSQGASDLHLVANNKPIIRIDGALSPVEAEKVLASKDVYNEVYAILTKEQQEAFEQEKDLDFAYQVDTARFRVNVHLERGNVGMAARAIPSQIPTMEEVMLPEIA